MGALIALIGLFMALLVYQYDLIKHTFLLLVGVLFFSVEIPLPGGFALSLPAEPLVLLLALCALGVGFHNKRALLMHLREPILFMVALLVCVWLVTAATSTMPLVSVKYVFINLVYIVLGLILFPLLLYNKTLTIPQIIRWAAIPLFFFAAFGVYNLLPYRFNPGAAPLIGYPFFKDHTIYSATLSLFVPPLLLWPFFSARPLKWGWLFPTLGVAVMFALFISSSRAAWLALLIAVIFYVLVRFGATLKHIVFLLLIAGFCSWIFADHLAQKIRVNPYTSTETTGSLQEQALSVTNVSSDVSNRERLNRWLCALRMGAEKPITGFGPGTYQFTYFPYQRDDEMTYISVTDPFNTIIGRGGSAHSEYLLLLAESGVFGALAWIGLQVFLLIGFFRIWQGPLPATEKNMALALYLSVLTYSVHSLFNNYLNTVQFGVSWWMLVGGLLYLKTKSTTMLNKHRQTSIESN